MKKAILAVMALFLLSTGVLAVDIDMEYTGAIDSYTGLPEGKYAVPVGVERIQLDNSSYYDFTDSRFVYTLSSGAELSSTVADGMVTTGPVSLLLPAGAACKLYRDGAEVTDADLLSLETPGNYTLSVNTNSGVSSQPLSFTIVNHVTGKLDHYDLPKNFVFTEAAMDGAAIVYTAQHADLTEEGRYALSYICQSTGITYQLDVEIDHTPPVLALSAVSDGAAKGPVDLSDLEPGTGIRIEQDGKEIGYLTELTESGSYHIWLQDEAGNTTEYQFTIQIYLNTSGILAIVLIAAVLLGLVFYLVYSRKKLRVR